MYQQRLSSDYLDYSPIKIIQEQSANQKQFGMHQQIYLIMD